MNTKKLIPRDLQKRYDLESPTYDSDRYYNPKGKYYEEAEAKLQPGEDDFDSQSPGSHKNRKIIIFWGI